MFRSACHTQILFILISMSYLSCSSSEKQGDWPTKPIHVSVGWSAGGTSDITTRSICLEMEKVLGQKILVTNVTGALGAIAATQVSRAPANGYHLFGGAAVLGTWPILGHSKVTWTDYYSLLGVVFPTTIFVMNDAPWKNLQDLISDIQNNPMNRFKYGHPGKGSNGDIFAALVLDAAGVKDKVISIPYKGGRESGRYLLSGEIDFASVSSGDLIDWAAAGRIRPLSNLFHEDVEFEGITFPSILGQYPELEPYQSVNPYMGIHINRNTPDEVVTRISRAFLSALDQAQFKDVVLKERAGILSPILGHAADEQMSKIESARCWALYDLGVAPNDPQNFDVPKLTKWTWPPHERAQNLKPWPDEVEILSSKSQ